MTVLGCPLPARPQILATAGLRIRIGIGIGIQYLKAIFAKNGPQIWLVSVRAADMPETCGFHHSLSFRAPMPAELWHNIFRHQLNQEPAVSGGKDW